MKDRITTNLKAVEGNLVRLMNTLVDRKAYDQVKEIERVRKRFNLLNTKQQSVWPQRVMREDQKKKWSLDSVVRGMVLLDEMILRDAKLFNNIIPPLEKVIINEAEEPMIVLLNHVSLLLTRMDRLITLKGSIRDSTGDRLLDTLRAELPDMFPRRLRRKAKRLLKKGNFEKLELRLEKKHKGKKYKKHFMKDLLKESSKMEKATLGSVLSETGASFEHTDEYKENLGMADEEYEQAPKDVETQANLYIKAMHERDQLLQKVKPMEDQIAVPNPPMSLNQQLMQMQMQIAQLSGNMQNAMGVMEDKLEDTEIYMKTKLGSDFDKLKNRWNLMREGKISKKAFIGGVLGTIGKRIAGVFGFGK